MTIEPMTEEDLRRKAARRAGAKLGFLSHLTTYVIVNFGLVAVNLATSRHYLWFPWVLFGWGIGLVAHGVSVFLVGSNLRERMIASEMERLRAQAGGRR